ncbi:MAG: c-type cytochrome [Balneolaceae bacterium]|nr:c-type cytochrome [Balneolaceae bacterium]MBO6545384.1 c-type cytochrome [Balneolaceae bacterium]MBO6646780.1 c-type cytochrome [Balneolaceae bacterium]
MKSFLILLITFCFGMFWSNTEPEVKPSTIVTTSQPDTSEFDQEKALAELREQIKGYENEPSSEVYTNIQFLKDVPAGRLLRIMEMGYSRSLGVTCTHCHNPDDWSSDEKKEKIITRKMSEMGRTINMELRGIDELSDRRVAVNCTTCHRGDVKPALNMPN